MIRKIEFKDIDKVNSLLKHFNYTLNRDVLKKPFFKGIVYDENEIKAVLIYSEIYDRIEVEYIIVLEKYLNSHIGSMLMEYLIDYSIKSKISNITLEVNICNKRAINLYKKFKFEEIAIRKNYYGENDAIVMIRKFDSNE